MVYTRYKCDRIPLTMLKAYCVDGWSVTLCMAILMHCAWKYFYYCSEEEERRSAWPNGYPWHRDPIARRNEDKARRLIQNNQIDITDPKWTGVSKEELFHGY